jgi:hypothetical protein
MSHQFDPHVEEAQPHGDDYYETGSDKPTYAYNTGEEKSYTYQESVTPSSSAKK